MQFDNSRLIKTSRRAIQNKTLDPNALAGWEQASLLPSTVLAGQRRDFFPRQTLG
jgi:hypothetical protein